VPRRYARRFRICPLLAGPGYKRHLRLDDHQGVQNAGFKPIKARENEPVEIAENKPLRRFSAQHIKLAAQRYSLRLEQGSRPEKPGNQPPINLSNPHEAEHRPIRNFMPAE
jgi:hypothetical protein